MSVKLELYRVFKEVAEAGNITAAAQTLFISHQAAGGGAADPAVRPELPGRHPDRRWADAV